MIILTATNASELENEWDCLVELMTSDGLLVITEPFVSKRLATTLYDVSVFVVRIELIVRMLLARSIEIVFII